MQNSPLVFSRVLHPRGPRRCVSRGRCLTTSPARGGAAARRLLPPQLRQPRCEEPGRPLLGKSSTARTARPRRSPARPRYHHPPHTHTLPVPPGPAAPRREAAERGFRAAPLSTVMRYFCRWKQTPLLLLSFRPPPTHLCLAQPGSAPYGTA